MKRIKGLLVKTEFCQKLKMNIGLYNYEMVKKDGCCIFLSGNKCTIYVNRPLICRFYPLTLFDADGYVFDVDRSCRGIGEGKVIDKSYFENLIKEAKKNLGIN